MGIHLEAWRARIGCFLPGPRRSKPKMAVISVDKESVHQVRALFILLFLLVGLPYSQETCTDHWPSWPNLLDPVEANTTQWTGTAHSSGTMALNEPALLHSSFHSMTLLLAGDVETNPGPGTDGMCIEGCTLKGRAKNKMIRCCLCVIWFHEECVNISNDTESGIWTCPECRLINGRVKDLADSLSNLTSLTEAIHRKIDTADQSRKEELEKLTTANESLTKENRTLQKSVADLTLQISELRWQSFRKEGAKSSALLGDSMIRDVCPQKLNDTKVVSKPGGTIQDINQEIRSLDKGYESLTLVVGGNDCAAKPGELPKDIVTSFGTLIDHAKEKSRKVTVASITPRLTSDQVQEKIDAVNAGLLTLCAEKDATFVDNMPSFRLGDGSLNDGYFTTDGVHLTRAGVNKLARNLKLPMKSNAEGVCRDKDPPRGRQRPGRQDTPSVASKQTSLSTEIHSVSHSSQRSSLNHRSQRGSPHDRSEPRDQTTRDANETTRRRREAVRCHYCSETGHVKGNCRHGAPIQCYSCRSWGHKSKLCSVL